MRGITGLLIAVIFIAGCEVQDENPNWNPRQDYPDWTYDAPFYYRPSEDLPVAEVVGDGIPIYYTNNRNFFIKHPTGYQLPGTPRVSVWYSTDAGMHWQRAGYFGVEQTHFGFLAEKDGVYRIRFVGPGQGIAAANPDAPDRIYVVDTKGPSITMTITPPPVEKDKHGNEIPHIYNVGETITVRWEVYDANLIPNSVHLATSFGTFPQNVVWKTFPLSFPASHSLRIPIPAEAAGHRKGQLGQFRIRLEASDKAGNVSFAFSEVLRVSGPPVPVAPSVRKARPGEIIVQEQGKPGSKPGWPQPGTLLRGGTSRVLLWLPKQAGKYKNVILQFSADNGRSWRTIAENLHLGTPVKWTVPEINSKICRLRILAVKDVQHRIMLAETQSFTINTAPVDTVLGPAPVPPPEAGE